MKTRTELMVMFTHHDVTVPNAYDLFEECKDLPVYDWGFKNAGVTNEETLRIINAMKAADKATFYEVVTRTKEAYKAGEITGALCKFDYMMGTKYDAELHEAMKKNGIKFSPAVGQPGSMYKGEPGVLLGTFDEIITEAKMLVAEKGVDGITIPAYRHYQDGQKLLDMLIKAIPDTPVIVAGSVDSFEKIDRLFDMGVAKFTMGSALFNKKFAPEGSFRDNLEVVANYIETKHPRA